MNGSDPEFVMPTEKKNDKKSPALFAGLKYSEILTKLLEATIIASNRKDFKTWCELMMDYYSCTSPFIADKKGIWDELENSSYYELEVSS